MPSPRRKLAEFKKVSYVNIVQIYFPDRTLKDNMYGSAWFLYSTGERFRVKCGGRWGHYLCRDCFLYLEHEAAYLVQDGLVSENEGHKLKQLLGAFTFAYEGEMHRFPPGGCLHALVEGTKRKRKPTTEELCAL